MEKSYGVTLQRTTGTSDDYHVEELEIKGFTIVPDVLGSEELAQAREKLDTIYATLASAYGEDNLEKINEKNLIRLPLKDDAFFLHKVAANEKIAGIVKMVLGDSVILHLQNAIINRPNEAHHQSSWHRDLPYQNFVISKPLAIGALYCIDDFTVETGCTHIVPFTHKVETIPSAEYIKNNQVPVLAKAGSVILFDAMLFHKAGYNSSSIIRRAINNVYVVPILKQQLDIPKMLGGKYADDPSLRKLLGYDFAVPADDHEWRSNRMKKMSNNSGVM